MRRAVKGNSFTLVEVSVAVLVLAIGLMSLLSVFPVAIRWSSQSRSAMMGPNVVMDLYQRANALYNLSNVNANVFEYDANVPSHPSGDNISQKSIPWSKNALHTLSGAIGETYVNGIGVQVYADDTLDTSGTVVTALDVAGKPSRKLYRLKFKTYAGRNYSSNKYFTGDYTFVIFGYHPATHGTWN